MEERAGGLARAAGRGFLSNLGFSLAVQGLLLVQHILVPRLIGPENLGLFALAAAVVGIGRELKQVGIHEKLVQDRDADFPLSLSNAFTLELALASVLFVAVLVVVPWASRLFDRPEMAPLVVVLAITIFSGALIGIPSAVLMRDLRFVAQNVVSSAGTVVSVLVTVVFAFLGLGVWSLVLGSIAAMVVSVVLLAVTLPFRPRLRLDGPIVRRYLRYGLPLLASGLLGLISTWGGTIVITSTLGVVALGYFTLADGIGKRAFQLDAVLGKTIFPVLVRAQHDEAAQWKAFVVITRLSVIWAGTLGFGLAVLAEDLVRHLLGSEWLPAVFLLRMQGVSLAVGSIGFSWDVFYRARGITMPTLVQHLLAETWVFLVLLPATAVWGLTGAGWAVLSLGAVAVAVRQLYVRRLFPGILLPLVAWRELLATGSAAACILGVRAVVGDASNVVEVAGYSLALLALVAVLVVALDFSFLKRLVPLLRKEPAATTLLGPASQPGDVLDPSSPTEPAMAGVVHAPGGTQARELSPIVALSGRTIARREQVPGRYPLYATPSPDGSVWVTVRDSSMLARVVPGDWTWRTWRFPLWPHVAAVDADCCAWVALTLSSAVVRVSPSGGVERIKVPRTRELLVAAASAGMCLVVDSGRRQLLVFDGPQWSCRKLEGAIRPDFVTLGPGGEAWVTDTARPVVLRVGPGERRWDAQGYVTEVVVPDGTRAASMAPDGRSLLVGHTAEPLVSTISVSDHSVKSYPLPGIPFGVVALADASWCAVPSINGVVRLAPDGTTDIVTLGAETQPTAVAEVAGTLVVVCAGSSELVVLE